MAIPHDSATIALRREARRRGWGGVAHRGQRLETALLLGQREDRVRGMFKAVGSKESAMHHRFPCHPASPSGSWWAAIKLTLRCGWSPCGGSTCSQTIPSPWALPSSAPSLLSCACPSRRRLMSSGKVGTVEYIPFKMAPTQVSNVEKCNRSALISDQAPDRPGRTQDTCPTTR